MDICGNHRKYCNIVKNNGRSLSPKVILTTLHMYLAAGQRKNK
jgi:hypothetical protein